MRPLLSVRVVRYGLMGGSADQVTRWRNEEYDRLFRESEGEMDPIKRASLFIRMNDLVVSSNHIIPLFNPQFVNGHVNSLRPALSGWDNIFWLLRDWHRVT